MLNVDALVRGLTGGRPSPVRRSQHGLLPKRLVKAAGLAMPEALEPRQLLSTVFVDADATGSGNGLSWMNAFTSLGAAIAAANSGDDIWVAEGTYTPGTARADSFELKSGVSLYGGFSGNETALGQRDPSANPTILSGEIGAAGIADNSFNVVTGSGNLGGAQIGGFTITRGNANGGGDSSQGGGVRLQNAVNVEFLSDTSFVDNTATNGGGLAIIGGTPTIRGTLQSNTATGQGGGLWVNAGQPVVQATFVSNDAATGGGGYWTNSAAGTINSGSVFTGNQATGNGGTFAFDGAAPAFAAAPTIVSSTAGGNGGAVWLTGASLSGSFNVNMSTATGNGGGIYVGSGGSLTMSGGAVTSNIAANGGGIFGDTGSTLAITGGSVNSNQATADGGGVYAASGLTFSGATINDNAAGDDGGGIWAGSGTYTLGNGSGLTASGNEADNRGGVFFGQNATVNISGSTISGGGGLVSTSADGGFAAVVGGTLNVWNSTISGFRTSGDGAVFYADASTVRLFNNRFYDNIAAGDGGVIAIKGASTTTIAGSVFSGNAAGGFGGAVEIGGGSATVVNTTGALNLVSNTAVTKLLIGQTVTSGDLTSSSSGFGGFLAVRSGATATIANTVAANNTAFLPQGEFDSAQVFVESGASATIRNSVMQLGLPPRAIDGGGVTAEDPIFDDASSQKDGRGADGQTGTADDDFDLGDGSPAIDTGDAADLPADVLDIDNDGDTTEQLPIDFEGRSRIGGTGVDMGAYESDAIGQQPPEPGAPSIGSLRGFASTDNEGNGPSDSFGVGSGFDLVAIAVQDGDGDLARVEYYYDSNDNGVLEPGLDLLLGTVAYAEDGPGGQGTFDATIDDDGFTTDFANIGFDGIPDALQGGNPDGIDNVPESFILRVSASQSAALGGGVKRFFARAVDSLSATSLVEDVEINFSDGSTDPNFSLIIGGSAQRPLTSAVPFATGARPEVIQLADLDGDGVNDAIVTTEDSSNRLTIWYGRGDGTFVDRYDVTGIPRSEDVVVRDFNDDGRLDFATANWRGSGTVTVGLNQGGRGASAFPASAVTNYAARGIRFSIDAGDLDGDGDIDLIAANLSTDRNTDIYLNNGNGGFSRINGPDVGNIGVGRIRLADVDSNGRLDVIYTNRSSNIQIIYAGSGHIVTGSSFTPGSTASIAYPQSGSKSLRGLRFADLNGDGNVDMVASNQVNSGTIAVYLNNGSGGFNAGTLYSVGRSPEDISLGDLNADDVLDIAVANTGSGNMSILINNGDGTLQPQYSITVGRGPEGIAIGDVTSDDINDIVTANISDNNISFVKLVIGDQIAVGTDNSSSTNFVGIINEQSNPVIFNQDADGNWFAHRVNSTSVFLVGQMTAITVDGQQHFFATNVNGLRWFFPDPAGDGTTYLELDVASFAGAPADADFAFGLSSVLDPQGNPHLFGLNSDGEYITIRRTGVVNGAWQWAYENITDDILANNPSLQTIPLLIEFEPYVTRWNQVGLAGVTDFGEVVSLWNAPANGFWAFSNLSDTVSGQPGSAERLVGGLATVITQRFDTDPASQTQWDGINIAGLTGAGELRVLWWAAANVNTDPNNLDSGWRVSNLTDPQKTNPASTENDLPAFSPDFGLASYFTPWGGINYVGFTPDDQMQVYWWVPGFAGQYISTLISDTLLPGTILPVADLTAYSAPNGLINIYGPGPQEETLRLWVDPFAPGSSWSVENLTEIAQRVE